VTSYLAELLRADLRSFAADFLMEQVGEVVRELARADRDDDTSLTPSSGDVFADLGIRDYVPEVTLTPQEYPAGPIITPEQAHNQEVYLGILQDWQQELLARQEQAPQADEDPGDCNDRNVAPPGPFTLVPGGPPCRCQRRFANQYRCDPGCPYR
jgi:hypothetical protein